MNSTTVRLRVQGVDCERCAARVRRALEELDGVSDIHELGEDGWVELEVDEDVTPAARRVEAALEAAGVGPSSTASWP